MNPGGGARDAAGAGMIRMKTWTRAVRIEHNSGQGGGGGGGAVGAAG